MQIHIQIPVFCIKIHTHANINVKLNVQVNINVDVTVNISIHMNENVDTIFLCVYIYIHRSAAGLITDSDVWAAWGMTTTCTLVVLHASYYHLTSCSHGDPNWLESAEMWGKQTLA